MIPTRISEQENPTTTNNETASTISHTMTIPIEELNGRNMNDDQYSQFKNNLDDLEAQQEREINKLKIPGSFYPTDVDWNIIGNFSGIESNVRKQLRGVYMLLAASVLCATFGSAVSVFYNLQPSILYSLVSIGLIIYVNFTSSMAGLLALGLSFGFQLGPLISLIITDIDPWIPLYALVGTTLIFSCFSVAAHFSKRRSMLFIGATLSSFLSLTVWTLFFSLIFGTFALYEVISVYGGLLMFCGYVVYDTQIIIERCHAGDEDLVRMALQLFINFIAIFVRILIILSKKRSRDNE